MGSTILNTIISPGSGNISMMVERRMWFDNGGCVPERIGTLNAAASSGSVGNKYKIR
jgi:hypothetical protein